MYFECISGDNRLNSSNMNSRGMAAGGRYPVHKKGEITDEKTIVDQTGNSAPDGINAVGLSMGCRRGRVWP
jgi:hypothetical protein